MTQQETITFAVDTAKLEEERVITGIAAPYGEVTVKGGRKLRFEKGLFAGASEAFLYFNHDESLAPIGKVFSIEDTDAGLAIKAKISKTARGDEIYELLKDGVLDRFSVGAIANNIRHDEDVEVWTAAELTEISVVPKPAFRSAAVAQVHSADKTHTKEVIDNNIMTEKETSEVVELRGAVDDLERKFALIERAPVETPVKFNHGGEFLKALAKGDAAAKAELKFAFTGATLEDNVNINRPAWQNRALRIVNNGRPVLNLFNRVALPAQPGSKFVEFTKYPSVTGDVALQVNEGDDLAYVEVALESATAELKTYGGYSSLSRQAIELSDASYLQSVLDAQAASYAKVTNAAVRTALTGASGVQAGTAITADTAAGWLGMTIEAAGLMADNGLGANAEFVVVSRDVWRRLVTLVDEMGRPLLDVNNDGSNTVGSAGANFRGNLGGLPLIGDAGLTGNNVFVCSSQAVTVYEQGNAPISLADDNIINLTRDFSLYGYLAVAVNNPAGIVKVNATLA